MRAYRAVRRAQREDSRPFGEMLGGGCQAVHQLAAIDAGLVPAAPYEVLVSGPFELTIGTSAAAVMTVALTRPGSAKWAPPPFEHRVLTHGLAGLV